MFDKFFSTYQLTDPLPIITYDYKIVLDNYNNFILSKSPEVYNLVKFIKSDLDDLGIKTDPLYDTIKLELNIEQDPVSIARQFIGTKYSWGGMSPSTGFDCSGLIKYAYNLIGIDLPKTAKEMSSFGTEVSLNDAKIGDIICTNSTGPSGKHVKMISKIENGLIYTIEAKGKKEGIVEGPLTNTNNIKSIRRIIGNNNLLFGSKKDYVRTMYLYLYQALENNGIDGDTWTPVLIAHTAIESSWGNLFSRRTNNFGGIKGKGSGTVTTREWNPTKGYYSIKSSFKSYPSIEAFADDYVKRLKNKFNAFNGNPSNYLYNIRNKGYFTANLGDYLRTFNSVIKDVNKLLSN